jgi:hypothetical protein
MKTDNLSFRIIEITKRKRALKLIEKKLEDIARQNYPKELLEIIVIQRALRTDTLREELLEASEQVRTSVPWDTPAIQYEGPLKVLCR